jgi:hypothetical protein
MLLRLIYDFFKRLSLLSFMNYNVCLFIIFWLFLESGQFEIVLTKPSCFTFAEHGSKV